MHDSERDNNAVERIKAAQRVKKEENSKDWIFFLSFFFTSNTVVSLNHFCLPPSTIRSP